MCGRRLAALYGPEHGFYGRGGAGEAIVPLVSTILAMWLIRVPAAVLFSRLWGEVGIWWAMPTGWALGMCISLGYYRSGKWTKKVVARRGAAPAA